MLVTIDTRQVEAGAAANHSMFRHLQQRIIGPKMSTVLRLKALVETGNSKCERVTGWLMQQRLLSGTARGCEQVPPNHKLDQEEKQEVKKWNSIMQASTASLLRDGIDLTS